MTAITLYAHPFSSYCQKVLIALYENAVLFDLRMLGTPEADAELAALWPLKRFPVIRDGDRTVFEATSIIDYLALHHPGPVRLIPADPDTAIEVRMRDRFFDNYVSTPMQTIVFDRIRHADARDPFGVAQARATLDSAYAWLEAEMAARTWAAGADFTLADCAAGPALFYADWVHPIGEARPALQAYRARLLARPSFARAVDEARPFRAGFPGGAPERD